MTTQLVLKSKDIINVNSPLTKQSLNELDPCKSSKPSNSLKPSTITIIGSNQNNKNVKKVKNTKPKLLNENDGKIKPIKQRKKMNEQKNQKNMEKNMEKNMKQNHAKKDPIKVQNEFMDAMTNAIIRFLEKNPESNKRSAEESVFIALGYDASIEYEREQEQNENNEDEDVDIDIDIDNKTKHRQSFLNKIKHYRQHHIMRDHDAVRTFRIKQLHTMIMQQHPTFQSQDVLQYLSKKLNELYLPSPSPPPPIIHENKENVSNQHEISIDKSKINEDNKNKTNLTNNSENTMKLSDIVETKNCKRACKDKSVNLIINQSINNNKKITMDSNNNNDKTSNNEKNEVISCNVVNNDKYKKDHSKQICDKNNNNNDKYDHNDNIDGNSSPSQIYITVNDTNDNNDSFRKHSQSQIPLKYNELSSSINSQGIAFQNTSLSKCNNGFITPSLASSSASSPFIGHYQANNTGISNYFVSAFNNQDDEVLKKMKFHGIKKSRKRKIEINKFENGAMSQIVQPPKKRTRYGGNKRSKKLRNKNNKSRSRGRGVDRKTNRNHPFGNQQSLRRNSNVNDNRSTDCFDDEEDEGSDIDLTINPNNSNNLLRTQAQHL